MKVSYIRKWPDKRETHIGRFPVTSWKDKKFFPQRKNFFPQRKNISMYVYISMYECLSMFGCMYPEIIFK